MVMLPGQKDRMRAREYHWRAGLYIYVNSSLDVHEKSFGLQLSCASSKHSRSGVAGHTHHYQIHEPQREIRHSTYYRL